MSDHAAEIVGLHRRQLLQNFPDDRPADGGESDAVVKTERREPMAFAAQVQNLAQGQFAITREFPDFFGGVVTVGSWFVQRFLFPSQRRIDGDHCFPRPVFQPEFFHLPLAADLRTRLDLIFCRVETPPLFRWPRPVLANNGSGTKRS
jgi:hypothetical protein